MKPFAILFLFLHLFSPSIDASGLKKRVSPYQYAVLPVLLVTNVFLNNTPSPTESHWQGGILLDNSVRNNLRGNSKGTRETLATIGDVVVGSLIAYPFAVDAITDRWIANGDGDSAGQMSLLAAQGMLLTGFLRHLTKVTIGRERPFQQECANDPNYDSDCNLDSSRSSFFSGHAAFSFTGAGLICSAHEVFNLAGGNAPCYAALGLATFVSMTRIVADKHYFTDTLVGAAVGLFSGYFLPKWINYNDIAVSPNVSENAWNISLTLPL